VSVEFCQRDVQRHQDAISKLQLEKSRESGRVAEETKRAAQATASAARTTSVSNKAARVRDAQRCQDNAVRHQQRVAEIESKIAREHGRLGDAQRRLAAAEAQEARDQARKAKQAERDHDASMRAMTGRLTHHDQLHRVAMAAIARIRQLPDEITVLFFAANPFDQERLRLDEEVRSIREEVRKSKHRESVRLESWWAVRPLDVLQAINEIRPRIVHFSGHGSDQDELMLQDAAGNTKFVSKEAIVQTMALGSDEIQLVFFNTCYSREQAEAVVQHVPAAIGMNTSISDKAARIFSAKFYSAIGFGLTLERAFQQAKAALMLEGIPEDSTPELFLTPGLEADELVLVAS